jgi:cobalamin biosynthesis protein CbiD
MLSPADDRCQEQEMAAKKAGRIIVPSGQEIARKTIDFRPGLK